MNRERILEIAQQHGQWKPYVEGKETVLIEGKILEEYLADRLIEFTNAIIEAHEAEKLAEYVKQTMRGTTYLDVGFNDVTGKVEIKDVTDETRKDS